MDIRELKKELRKEMSFSLPKGQKLNKEIIAQRIDSILRYWKESRSIHISEKDKEAVISQLCDDFLGFGPLQKLMDDEEITEIMVNGPKKIYIEKSGRKVLSDVQFDDGAHLRYIVERMIMPSGRRIDESYPYVDFSLADGSRVNVIISPVAVGGPYITIRKFLRSISTVDDLVKLGTIDQRMADFLVAGIKAKINMLFSGATGSGKTTTLEVLSSYIDKQERIITIEDTLELKLMQDHVARLLTRPVNIEGKGGISIRDLFVNTLRMRPSRIILGEIRGKEAMDYLQALNSGHGGSLAVIHASSPRDAMTRLETMALYAGLNLPAWVVRKQISSGIDIVIQHNQLPDGSRKITHITEVGSLSKDNEIQLHDIFTYEVEGIKDNKVQGKFTAKGVIPSFYENMIKRGASLDKNIFNKG